jgi:lysophospholipid acyltransferase (LPLAT)-like uncharacterized protein
MAERSDGRPVAAPRQERGWLSTVTRRFLRSETAYNAAASVIAAHLRTVWRTGRMVPGSASPEVLFNESAPLIGTSWHGDAFLVGFVRAEPHHVDVMVSRAVDGEIMSRAVRKLGGGVVRGSGAGNPARMHEKGSVAALRALKASLDRGNSVFMTADYTGRGRGTASLGLPVLARLSQRPVIPLAIATSGAFRAGSWDRVAIPLPFSRIAFVHSDPVYVPRRADDALLEEKRLEIERALKAVSARANELVGRSGG